MARTTHQEYFGTQLVNSSAKPSMRKLMAMKQWFGDINKFFLIGDYFVDGWLLALESEAENYCSLSLYLLVANVMPRIYSMNST